MTEKMPKKEITEDTAGEFGFRVKWMATEYWLDVEVYEIVARGENSEPLFQRNGANFSPDCVEFIDDAEKYISGYIKWDGCSELDIGCPHWCGWDSYLKHIQLLGYLYKRGMELIRECGGDPLEEVDISEFSILPTSAKP